MLLSVFSSIVLTIFIEDTNITNQWFTEGSYNTLLLEFFFFSYTLSNITCHLYSELQKFDEWKRTRCQKVGESNHYYSIFGITHQLMSAGFHWINLIK